MRTSSWTPSIVPSSADQTVYIVENDFGEPGRAFVETDGECADLEAKILGLLEGQFSNRIRIIAFNTAERWSEDVSEDIGHELRRRCDLQLRDVPSGIQILSSVMRDTGSCRCGWFEQWHSSGKSLLLTV